MDTYYECYDYVESDSFAECECCVYYVYYYAVEAVYETYEWYY